MTTPQVMGSIVKRLRNQIAEAEGDYAKADKKERKNNAVGIPNSDEAAYFAGYRDALKGVLQDITGDE